MTGAGAEEDTRIGEDAIAILSNPTHTRVSIRLPKAADVRVVDQIQDHDYFFVDIYGIGARFGNKRFNVFDGVLNAILTVDYPDQGVLRVIFYPAAKTVFRVADRQTAFVYPPTPASATEFVSSSNRATELVIDTSKRRQYPLPPLLGDPALPARLPRSPGGEYAARKIVVLDPGHGGRDPGTTSQRRYGRRRLQEKELVLEIAREVQRLLAGRPDVEAVLTRASDRDLGLRDRVEMAESLEDGDLFVSIHINATRYHQSSDTARGMEIYYLSANSKAENRLLLAAENQAGAEEELDPDANAHLSLIERNLIKDIIEAHRGAGAQACAYIHRRFTTDRYFRKYNRGVKSAPFRVLMNRVMPAVLIEVGFIDHPEEARQLADPDFQRRIARLIAQGILDYLSARDAALTPSPDAGARG